MDTQFFKTEILWSYKGRKHDRKQNTDWSMHKLWKRVRKTLPQEWQQIPLTGLSWTYYIPSWINISTSLLKKVHINHKNEIDFKVWWLNVIISPPIT